MHTMATVPRVQNCRGHAGMHMVWRQTTHTRRPARDYQQVQHDAYVGLRIYIYVCVCMYVYICIYIYIYIYP